MKNPRDLKDLTIHDAERRQAEPGAELLFFLMNLPTS